jgi:hypothetical protein
VSGPLDRLKVAINARIRGVQRPLSLANQLHLELSQELARVQSALSGSSGVARVNGLYSAAIKSAENARDAVVQAETELRAMYDRVGNI